MTSVEQYSVGWIDSSLHDFLRGIGDPTQDMSYALITCVDSDAEVAAVLHRSPHLAALRPLARIVGRGVLLETARLLEAMGRQRMFFGFDELWFFSRAHVDPSPDQGFLTGPLKLAGDLHPRLQGLVAWMERNNCSLGLGDGTGLNFVAKLPPIARFLLDECAQSAWLKTASGIS